MADTSILNPPSVGDRHSKDSTVSDTKLGSTSPVSQITKSEPSQDSYVPHSGLKKLITKLWMVWLRAVGRIRFISQACLDSDEIADEMFDSDDHKSKVRECGCHSSKCRCVKSDSQNAIRDKSTEGDRNVESKISINPNDLKNGKPFTGGEELWNKQHEQWLKPSPENVAVEGKMKLLKRQQSRDIRRQVGTRDYPVVYRNLVLNDRILKNPMNLRDLIKVLEVGWAYDSFLTSSRRSHPTL